MNYVSVNYSPVKSFVFPGGEVGVVVNNYADIKRLDVTAFLYNSEAFMQLAMATNALRNQGFGRQVTFNLKLPYFPYARQDRICNEGEAHGVQAMASLINSLEYDSVTVYDPHSEAVQAAVKNCIVTPQWVLAGSMLSGLIVKQKWELVSPDAGAEKKVNTLAKQLGSWGLTPPVHYAAKVRNLANGQILSTRFDGNVEGKNLVIVDDICDGGRTFIELAKVLKEKGANKVALYVTHGIFSQGLDVLKEHIDQVYCIHAFNAERSDFLTIA